MTAVVKGVKGLIEAMVKESFDANYDKSTTADWQWDVSLEDFWEMIPDNGLPRQDIQDKLDEISQDYEKILGKTYSLEFVLIAKIKAVRMWVCRDIEPTDEE